MLDIIEWAYSSGEAFVLAALLSILALIATTWLARRS